MSKKANLRDNQSLLVRVLKRVANEPSIGALLAFFVWIVIPLFVVYYFDRGEMKPGEIVAVISIVIICGSILYYLFWKSYREERQREWQREPWKEWYEGVKLRVKNYWGPTEEEKKRKLERIAASARSADRWQQILKEEKERLEKVSKTLPLETISRLKQLVEEDEEDFDINWIIDFYRIPEIELDAAKEKAALDGSLVDQLKEEGVSRRIYQKRTGKKEGEEWREEEEEEE